MVPNFVTKVDRILKLTKGHTKFESHRLNSERVTAVASLKIRFMYQFVT